MKQLVEIKMRFAALLMAVVLACAITPVKADDREPRIEVTGIGEATLAPDMAVVTLTVTREADTAGAALEANNEAMDGVLAAMREEGIEERDLQTSGFSIMPRMVYPNDNNRNDPPRIAGYTVTNSLTVRVRDLGKLGAMIDRSVDLGVNQGGDIAFSNADPSQAIDEARAKAVRDAIRRAETLAVAAGGSLGGVISITEHGDISGPRPMAKFEAAVRSADAVPVAAGENSYRVMVSAAFRYRDEDGHRKKGAD